MAQAQAAVARAVTVLSSAEIWLSGTVANIELSKCVGCGVCWTVCPYQAIDPDENGLAVVNEALCKGCGTCVAACPAQVIRGAHFHKRAGSSLCASSVKSGSTRATRLYADVTGPLRRANEVK